MILMKERQALTRCCHRLAETGLAKGSSGNVSIRRGDRIAISPSGVDNADLKEHDVVIIDLEGKVVEGRFGPSSEMPFHLAVYRQRQDARAVVHTHSPSATAVACLGIALPAVHYMVACVGPKVPLVPYSTFGSDELAASVQRHLGSYNGLLLENHGVLALGESIEQAFANAENIEFVADIYLKCLASGMEPKILSDAEMGVVVEKFKTYGKPLETS